MSVKLHYRQLSVSLYCSKEHWNKVLSDGIDPLVDHLWKENKLKYYHLVFNYSSGENIRLSLFVPSGKAKSVARYVDEYCNHFFSVHKLPSEEIQFPVDGVFMPFPANSVQYGLFGQEYYVDNDFDLIFQSRLSSLLILILKDVQIDDAEILTLSFYLHFSLLKIVLQTCRTAPHELRELRGLLAPGGINMDLVQRKMADNRDMLIEIADEIMQMSAQLPDWLITWKQYCEERIEKRNSLCTDRIIEGKLLYAEISMLINKQLGLNEQMRLLLFYFLDEVYEEQIRKSILS